MGVYDKEIKGGNGINYTKEVDGPGDYALIANNTRFKDLSTGEIKYKNPSGIIVGVFSTPEIKYEVAFVDITEMLQFFDVATNITEIKTKNIDALEYQLNQTGGFTSLVLDGNGVVTSGLPLNLSANDTVNWKITYTSGKTKASLIIKGYEV